MSTSTGSNNLSWVIWIIIAIIAFAFISNYLNDKKQSDMIEREFRDVNYCRSVAAQYGQQGTAAFSQSYDACMTAKGW